MLERALKGCKFVCFKVVGFEIWNARFLLIIYNY